MSASILVEAMWLETVAMDMLRDGDIAESGERRQGVKALGNKTDPASALLGAVRILHGRQIPFQTAGFERDPSRNVLLA